MESIINRITRGHFWHFHGGIHPPQQKFLTKDKPIRNLPLPEQLILPIQQHIGQPGDLLVSVGDRVLKGQVLTKSKKPTNQSMVVPVHAPTSGIVTAIKNSVIAHPSGLSSLCIFIEPDGEDKWQERNICEYPELLTREQVIDKITSAGIAGMGGAGFPTHIKVNIQPEINYLIINAAECEPYITADDLLIREHSATILDGINILERLLTPHHILIGIEDNKPEAIKVLQQATADNPKIKVCVLPTKYPTGGEKQLIQVLTGQEVPSGVIPRKLGIVMQNIATCFAIADAVIFDTPLIRRVVTVSGQALDKPQNVWALLGTPINYLLEQCHYQNTGDTGQRNKSNVNANKHVIMGGPMMGFSLSTDQVPVVKITNCVLAPSKDEIPADNKEVECIRCGQCAEVCPAQLLPQELQWSAKAKDHQQLTKLNLADCIECGACAYVCPSQIPLVHYYRIAKAEMREQHVLHLQSEKAKTRFEARKVRLEKEKLARETKQKKAADARKAKMAENTPEASNAKSAVAAALARVKAKKAKAASLQPEEKLAEKATLEKDELQADKKSQVAAAIARAKAKKLAAKASASKLSDAETEAPTETSGEKPETDTPKVKTSETEASQAKASQTKASQPKEVIPKESVHKTNNYKKLKIAAAIAKAKAKKAQKLAEQNQSENSDELPQNKAETSLNEKAEAAQAKKIKDDEKAKRIAAAVAKAKAAKAKRQEQQNKQNQQEAE